MKTNTSDISAWYRKFRVQRDAYSGYEVRCWRIWWPFWVMYPRCNTHRSVTEAKSWISYQILCRKQIKENQEKIKKDLNKKWKL